MIHLQEIAAIDRGNKERYLDWLRTEWSPFLENSRGMRLVWVGSTIGSTARWPETIALWELRDWTHYADVCARMYTESSPDAELRRLWQDAAKLRLRSESRTLVGAPFSPTLDELETRGIAGTVFAFASFRIRRGEMKAFFEAVRQRATDGPRRLAGAYEVAFTNDRAYAVWAHSTLAEAAAYEASRGNEHGFGDGVEEWSEHWGFASPGSPLWPKEYRTDTRVW